MKIWILEIGEPLPLEKDVRLHRYGQFSKFLASQAGHQVTWWTSSFSHAPKIHLVEKDSEKTEGNWRLKLLKGPGYKKNVSFARIRHQKHFAQRFSQLAAGEEQPDLIIAPVPTIENAKAAIDFGLRHNIPVIVDIRDLWPDELRDLAPSLLRPVAKILLFKAYQKIKYVCKNASGLMAVSQSYLDYGLKVAQRQQGDRDLVFPLGYSNKEFSQDKMQEAEQWVDDLAIRSDELVVCFFGTIGNYFDLETVINAARKLKKEFPVRFILGGHGSRLDQYKHQAQDLPEIQFPGWLNGPQIQTVMKKSHVGLAPYSKEAKMSLPNKPFEYMAGGLPIASSIQGELKAIINQNQCGISYQADSVDSLCSALRQFQQNPKEREKMGQNAKNLLKNHFNTDKIFANVNSHLSNLKPRHAQ